jgi:hypothetical protein
MLGIELAFNIHRKPYIYCTLYAGILLLSSKRQTNCHVDIYATYESILRGKEL